MFYEHDISQMDEATVDFEMNLLLKSGINPDHVKAVAQEHHDCAQITVALQRERITRVDWWVATTAFLSHLHTEAKWKVFDITDSFDTSGDGVSLLTLPSLAQLVADAIFSVHPNQAVAAVIFQTVAFGNVQWSQMTSSKLLEFYAELDMARRAL